MLALKPDAYGAEINYRCDSQGRYFLANDLFNLKPTLLSRLEHDPKRHPDARYTNLVESLEGISRNDTEMVSARGIKIGVTPQFDAALRAEAELYP